ncbi:Aim11 protein [Saccharomycopsis crataegensis]|uniref:Altered inheritance of mitochondria protein 11 n=1 Tax=Saccharomycopsis crataegensis TaxID=43959 RepID=A0AAV5QFI0_9ASCO|nr:Aim11 protein [Saccharomycopsis crataegensis]
MSEAKQSQSILTSKIMAEASDNYKQRRRTQMIKFYAATFTTLICSRLVFRGVQSRKYIPTLFQANHIQPSYSKRQEAMAAIGYASLLSTSAFGMFIFGTAWVMDISSAKDFGQRMKKFLGGQENQEKIKGMKTDEDTLKVQEGLSSLLEGNKE